MNIGDEEVSALRIRSGFILFNERYITINRNDNSYNIIMYFYDEDYNCLLSTYLINQNNFISSYPQTFQVPPMNKYIKLDIGLVSGAELLPETLTGTEFRLENGTGDGLFLYKNELLPFLGTWADDMSYTEDDVVLSEEVYYRCIVDNTNKPLSNKTYWENINYKADVSFITRPFNFGTTDTKKLERTILRARLHLSEDIISMNHCSNDGINFVPVQGRTFIDGNYRDIDLGLMAKNKHKQFIYAFAAKLDEDSQINLIDAEVSPEYTNEKMR